MTPLPWLAAGVALLAVAGFAGVQTLRLSNERAAHAETKAAWQTQVADAERLGRLAESHQREVERDWIERQAQASAAASRRAAALRSSLAAARSSGSELRDALAAAYARCDSAGTGASVPRVSESARAPADLPADVSRRLDEAADRIAQFAEAAMSARQVCEESWPNTNR